MYTTLQQYIRARWRNLSHESRRTMGLDKPERYLFLIQAWAVDYYERRES